MLVGIGGYNPSQVRKRKKKEKSKAKEVLIKQNHKSGGHKRPDGEKGLVWDALEYIYLAKKALKEIGSTFDSVSELCHKALNFKLADNERASIHRRYMGALRNYDYTVTHGKVKEEAVFEGIYAEHNKVIKLDSNGKKEMALKIPSLTSNSLRLHITKVDSIVSARKAEKTVEEVQKKIKSVETLLNNKEMFIHALLRDIGMTRPNFDGSGTEEEAQEEPEEVQTECMRLEFINLKRKQNRAAHAKGRTSALLVNLVI